MSKKALFGLIAAVLVAVAVSVPLRKRTAELAARKEKPALSMIPPGPAFLLTVDVADLRKGYAASLFGRHLAGLSSLSKRCDFEPLAEVQQLALAVPSGEGPLAGRISTEDFGVVATGAFAKQRVLRCAELSIRDHGGEPIATRIGMFDTVRDRSKNGGELAVRDGGPLILSGGRYFRELLDAAGTGISGDQAAAARDRVHAELRRALGTPAPLLASWVLPENWAERLLGDGEARSSRLAGVRAVGLRASFEPKPALEAVLACSGEVACNEAAGFLEELRRALGPELDADARLRLVKRIALTQDGTKIRLKLELERRELESLLDLAAASGPAPPKTP